MNKVFNAEFIRENNLRLLADIEIAPRYIFKGETKENSTSGTQSNDSVDDDMKIFILNVFPCQYRSTLTQIYKKAGFSAGTGNRVAERCVKNNLVKIVKSRFGKGNPRYPVLLPSAYEVLDIEELKFKGKGGYEHRLYLHLIKDRYSTYSPILELDRGGKSSDIGIETNEGLLCIEVEMSKAHIKENIQLDHEKCQASYIVVCCIDDKVLKAAKDTISKFPEEIKDKTEACLIKDILNNDPSKLIDKLY